MTQPTVSVVVVSQQRPESLLWCLTALAGARYEPFEIVVVADETGFSTVLGSVFAEKVKLVRFDEANISAARNRGIAQAAGEIIAFIDDDAAAEPMWLAHLVAPFENPRVGVTGGYVRGRNGISFQWTAREVDLCGRAYDLETAGEAPFTPPPRKGRAVKTEGTNMAVRREVLQSVGGFDEAYHFYLDETDLNLRLLETEYQTALVPQAEVHHGYKASTRRGDDRAVKDLFDVGASSAVLLRKFGQPLDDRLAEIREEQRLRLSDQQNRGLLSAADVQNVLASLERGIEAGMTRPFHQNPPDFDEFPEAAFLPFTPMRRESCVVSGRWRNRHSLRQEAASLAAQGYNVSLYLLSLDTRFHHARFGAAGYWEQSGGQFGRSDRHEPLFQLTSFRKRLLNEQARVKHARG